jgi:putative hemolysin
MEILILILLIALNGVFAMSEIAIVSSRRVRLEYAADRGSRGAAAALLLAASPTRFLSAIQVGITLIVIVSGAFGEAALADDLRALVERWPTLAPYGGLIATTIVVLGITYLSVVIGELVPKRLALHAPEKVAAIIAPPMTLLARIASPFVGLLSGSTEFFLKLIGIKAEDKEAEITAEDIRGMIEQATQTGVFLQKEQELVERIFRLGDQRVSALMVPRGDIVWLESDWPVERIRVAVAAESHSHFPVARKGLETLLGVVHLKDMVKAGLLQNRIDLKVLARQPMYVPESMPALRLLEEFRKGQTHIAFVLDEYGVLAGLITLNDLVESLLGHMSRAGEESEPLVIKRADGSYLLDGALPIGELKSLMELDELPHEKRTTFNTLAGFIMTHLGRVPHSGDSFAWDRYRFEVVDMDRHRIDKVLLNFKPCDSDPDERLHNEAAE